MNLHRVILGTLLICGPMIAGAQSKSPVTTIDNPGGGTIAYAQLPTSDYLRGTTVIHDTELNGHGRVSDDVADALVHADPNRFEVVPPSQYVQGIDY